VRNPGVIADAAVYSRTTKITTASMKPNWGLLKGLAP